MKRNGVRLQRVFSLLFLVLVLPGCAGTVKHMREVAPDAVSAAPAQGMSRVVFMRPSGMGYAIQSSVFEVRGSNPSLVGIVAAKKKVVYEVEPGEHLFMVIGESADFMSAELEADKTYYSLVTPRMGLWKARFSLKPIAADELDTEQFNEWLAACTWVEKSDASDQWAMANLPSIQEKRQEYYKKWMEKDAAERPHLRPQDGR